MSSMLKINMPRDLTQRSFFFFGLCPRRQLMMMVDALLGEAYLAKTILVGLPAWTETA